MRKELKINGLRWTHITRPKADDLAYVENLFPFHPLVMESIAAPTLHPLAEDYGSHLYLILHFPIIHETWQANEVAEIDFLITKRKLVTITYMDFGNLDEIFKDLRENPSARKQITRQNTGFLVYHILDRLFQKQMRDIDYLEEELTAVENKIFHARNRKLIEEIAHLRRDILDFRRAMRPRSAALQAFGESAGKFFGESMAPYFLNLLTTEDKTRNFIDNQKETIDALHQTNESLMSSTISNIIALLTVFSAIILPLNFIASIWGMNQRVMPLRDGQYDFWIVIAAMLALASALFFLFRKKKWL